MRKVFMMSALVLAITGCANQQHNTPQVRDLSEARRAVENSPQYTVKAGDTLYGIAWQHNLDYRQLAAMNSIDAPYQIHPGQTIALRAGGAANTAQASAPAQPQAAGRSESRGVVATGLRPQATAVASNDQELDWLLPDESAIERNQRLNAEHKSAETPDRQAVASAQEVAANNDRPAEPPAANEPEVVAAAEPETQASKPDARQEPVREPAEQAVAQSATPAATPPAPQARVDRSSRTFTPAETINWQWPTNGQVTGKFGEGDSITAGIDIAGQKGQPVKAAGPGIVVYAGSGVRGYGNLILLKHNDQFLSAYAHNDSLSVSENDVVEAGEVIATMGNSDAESVRLHFEVRRDGQPQDPLNFLPSR